jgi:type IV secretory pathway VirD2 relaxase
MRQARQLRRTSRSVAAYPHGAAHQQRCAVRVLYSKNTTRGQWRAHGRYIARESAVAEGNAKTAGFDKSSNELDIEGHLNAWQKAGDERLWKFIISPEFGDRLDMEKLTRELMDRVERELGTSTEWVAVTHYNTDHRHTHVALRGVDSAGRALLLDRQFVQRGIRQIAQDLCTRQLGYRTPADAAAAQQREVLQHRYTALDRTIKDAAQKNPTDPPYLAVSVTPGLWLGNTADVRGKYLDQRLRALSKMGLAEERSRSTWQVRSDFDKVLHAMQKSADRQKTLMAHGVVLSDERLPFNSFDFRRSKSVEGRVLVHGEEEESGRRYLMIEGTDAKIHHLYSMPELDEVRSRGGLRPNSFIRLRKAFVDSKPVIEVQDLGNADELLGDARHFEQAARYLLESGTALPQESFAGWLGQYQKALLEAAQGLEPEPLYPQRIRSRTRAKQHSFGR